VTGALDDYRREWTIDVSSPGLARPLRKREHFAAVVGSRVSIRTSRPVDARVRFRGVVKEVGGSGVVLELPDGGAVNVPYELIVRGNLIDEG
jgi:ribosome maturation factor RimP